MRIDSFASFTKKGIVDFGTAECRTKKDLLSWKTIEEEVLEEEVFEKKDLAADDTGAVFPWLSTIVIQPTANSRTIDSVSVLFSAVLRILNESAANPQDSILVSWRRSADPEQEIKNRRDMEIRRKKANEIVHLASERRLASEREAKRIANMNPQDRAS